MSYANAMKMDRGASIPVNVLTGAVLDPFEDDDVGDMPYVTSERRIQRLMIIAADVGARFAREGISHEPLSWMIAPRDMFEGRNAIEACQSVDGFIRATVLHGLSLGLDAPARELDALLGEVGTLLGSEADLEFVERPGWGGGPLCPCPFAVGGGCLKSQGRECRLRLSHGAGEDPKVEGLRACGGRLDA